MAFDAISYKGIIELNKSFEQFQMPAKPDHSVKVEIYNKK